MILFHNSSTGEDSWAPASGNLPIEMSNVNRPKLLESQEGEGNDGEIIGNQEEDDFEDSLDKLMNMGFFYRYCLH